MKKIFKDIDVYSIKNYLGKIKDKEKITECIRKNQIDNFKLSSGYNFPIRTDYNNFFHNLQYKIHHDCEKIFNFTVCNYSKDTCYCYMSDRKNYAEIWHNHVKTSTINTVYYFNIPKNKTSIDFLSEKNKKIYTHTPLTDELLIFPNYTYHKPNRPLYDGDRISINFEISCKEPSIELFSRIKKSNKLLNILKWILK